MELKILTTIEDFAPVKVGDELIVVWNPNAEVWNKEMEGKKIYTIEKIQKASARSPYPDEIILKHKGNIFFNFRLFADGESRVVKEVYKIL